VNITTLKNDLVGRFISPAMCLLLATGYAAPAGAQFKLQQTFENTTAPGWTLSDSALLTAPSIDAAGSGWLRLTAAMDYEKGLALNDAFSFTANQPVVVEFDYVSWGGTGADGMTLFLYDPTVTSPMSNAAVGGGLGYCVGAGGYLGIGLDEYGNFSNPGDRCGAASLGPGFRPESLVIRGPESANNKWVTTTSVPGGIDNPQVTTRPAPKTVLMSLTPAVSPAIGYTITAQFQSGAGQPFQTLFSNVAFPYAAPTTLAVGFSASTGGSSNNHELHGLVTATPDDLQVTMNGPSSVLQGAPVTYNVTLTNNGMYPIDAADAPTLLDTVPAAVTGTTWTCVGTGGATCDASGTGSIDTSNVTLPVNAAVTYSVTGTLNAAATCGSTLTNTANADFGSGSTFLDPDETNNSATVDSTVICDVTLVANPATLNFAPQTVNAASDSQTVTLTEGINGTSISSIAVTGDYTQTNNCPASLTASQTCTINIVFKPTTEGSRKGTLTILSNAASSPTLSAQVNLSGTGTNDAPSPFSFTPLNKVDLSSPQVSNAVTVANTNVPSPISVSSGAQYSINGGPFTSVPGIVSPGAQVRVRVTASASFSTAVSAVLTIGGVDSSFSVTTGTQPVLQGGFTALNGTAPSSVQVSNPITVTGTTIAVPIAVSSGAEYSINGGAFTSAPGVVEPGDQVRVRLPASSAYGTTDSALLDIGGIETKFSVSTGPQPQNIVVTGGGGAMDAATVLVLALLALLRVAGLRRSMLVASLAIVALSPLVVTPARAADDGDWLSNVYGGIRLGGSSSSMTAGKLTADLRADGYDVSAADSERSSLSGTLYVGYELPRNLAVELGWSYLGRTRAVLEGFVPPDLNPLLDDAAHIVRGSGDIVSLEARYRWELAPRVAVDLRAGPYVWITRTDVWVDGADALGRTDDGLGYTLGVGPRYALGQHLGLGISADYFASTSENHFVRASATVEYNF